MSDRSIISGLRVYLVGGAIRDELLGLPSGDRDWVVVGTTPEEMVRRGFVPVGGDFPVFLHPETKEEYALARTERKSGRGYRGFTFYTGPDVSLEADLSRRDLTVNAMARGTDGILVDPFGGQQDLLDKRLRHVGPAFAEDPVRILRLARFAARFADFVVAEETLTLCQQMTDSGEVSHLVPERVWQELSRGLMSRQPSRMFEVLAQCRASVRVMPGWIDSANVRKALDRAAQFGAADSLHGDDSGALLPLPLEARYGLLCLETSDTKALSQHLKVPTDCADIARLLPQILSVETALLETREPASAEALASQAERVLSLIETCDGLRKPERFVMLLRTAGLVKSIDLARWVDCLASVRQVDAGAIAMGLRDPSLIKSAVRQARLAALG